MSVPAVVLDTTLSGEYSNSYADIATCDDYWTNHWNTSAGTAYLALNTAQKTNLLMQACRVIETGRFVNPTVRTDYQLRYSIATRLVMNLPLMRDPIRYFWYQRLQFPRNLDIHFTADANDDPLGSTYIPNEIIWAQCEQAAYIMSFDTTVLSNQIQGISLDKIAVGKNLAATQEYTSHGSMWSPVAEQLVRPFLLKGGKLHRS